jgi:hypothetical protein
MNWRPRASDVDLEANVVGLDKDDRPVLLVYAKAMENAAAIGLPQLLEHLDVSEVRYGMFAYLGQIQIFSKNSGSPATPVCSLRTADVLSVYEPQYCSKRIFQDYFEGLIEAWLRDFAFHWRTGRPPASNELESIGLAQILAGGMTRKGGNIDAPPLY